MRDESAAAGPWQWVSVTQASAMIGLSPATIRRRIRDGMAIAIPGHPDFVLQAEREERPQGSLFLVRLPVDLGAPPPEDTSGQASEATRDASAPDAAQLARGAVEAAVAPWVVQLARAQDAMVEQSHEIGLLHGKLESATRRGDELALERDHWRIEARRWETLAEEGQNEYAGALGAAVTMRQLAEARAAHAEERLADLEASLTPQWSSWALTDLLRGPGRLLHWLGALAPW